MGDANVFNVMLINGLLVGFGFNPEIKVAFIGLGLIVLEWNYGQKKTAFNRWVAFINDFK